MAFASSAVVKNSAQASTTQAIGGTMRGNRQKNFLLRDKPGEGAASRSFHRLAIATPAADFRETSPSGLDNKTAG
jgi:hypothetical protein